MYKKSTFSTKNCKFCSTFEQPVENFVENFFCKAYQQGFLLYIFAFQKNRKLWTYAKQTGRWRNTTR